MNINNWRNTLEKRAPLPTSQPGTEYNGFEKNYAYRLSFDELEEFQAVSTNTEYSMYKGLTTFAKRMALSSIMLPPADKNTTVKRHDLSDGCRSMIRSFEKAVDEGKPSIENTGWKQASDVFWTLLHGMLTNILNVINIDKRYSQQNQKIIQVSETDFITKYFADFLQHRFNIQCQVHPKGTSSHPWCPPGTLMFGMEY